MTYKQVKISVENLLNSHPQINDVRFATPREWLKLEGQNNYPVCCFAMNNGQFDPGYKVFNLQLWFLDLAGVDGEFEVDVVSDQTEIANDIVGLLKQAYQSWEIDENISFDVVLEKFEDFLSGVQLSINLKTINTYDTCISPTTL